MGESHHRRSIRLPGYDYAQAGAYFVTICTHQRECLLGQVHGGAVRLSDYGELVEECWRGLPLHFGHIEVDVHVIMPNHIHGIILILGEAPDGGSAGRYRPALPPSGASPLQPANGTRPGSLSAIVQNLKSVSARRINQLRGTPGAAVWQRNYYEHIIRNERRLAEVRRYILENPARWDLDHYNVG